MRPITEVGYGAYIKGKAGEAAFFLRLDEVIVRQLLREDFPDEVVDRVISRLRTATERAIRRS